MIVSNFATTSESYILAIALWWHALIWGIKNYYILDIKKTLSGKGVEQNELTAHHGKVHNHGV